MRVAKRVGLLGVIAAAVWLGVRAGQGRVPIPDCLTKAVVDIIDPGISPTSPSKHFEVSIELGDVCVSVVEARFLSVAIDISLVVGGHWWSPSGEVEAIGGSRVPPLDLTNSKLRDLARALAPAYLRIGGTEADKIFYSVGQPEFRGARPSGELTLTRNRWDGLFEFVRSTQLALVFTLSAGPNSRDSHRRWNGENAEQLLRYAQSHHQRIEVIEFGNEINGYWFTFGPSQQPSGAQVAADLGRLRALVRQYAPYAKIAGPGEFYWPRLGSPLKSQFAVLPGLLDADRGRNLDIITWHYYPQQSRRCPVATRRASLTGLMNPSGLDEILRWSSEIEALRDQFAPGLPVWLGETGNAQCGGEPGVSDRFASSLWWLDHLGLLAVHGQSVVVRQALVGSDYGLLDAVTQEPRPDYFASLLHKRLMGRVVLDVRRRGEADPFLRIYAQCAPKKLGKEPGAVTILAINLHQREASVLKWPTAAGLSIDSYQVDAPSLRSPVARLGGRPMKASAGRIALEPHRVQFTGEYSLAPASYAFLVAEISAPACIEDP